MGWRLPAPHPHPARPVAEIMAGGGLSGDGRERARKECQSVRGSGVVAARRGAGVRPPPEWRRIAGSPPVRAVGDAPTFCIPSILVRLAAAAASWEPKLNTASQFVWCAVRIHDQMGL